jgi:hypothetical protein
MALNSLFALMAVLKADPDLNNHAIAVYGKPFSHFIGARPPTVTDCPALCYVPPLSTGDGTLNKNEVVSVVIGVNDPTVADAPAWELNNDWEFGLGEPPIVAAIKMGHVRCGEISDLIRAAIGNGYLGSSVTYLGRYRQISDLGERHPFYELELQLFFIYRGP